MPPRRQSAPSFLPLEGGAQSGERVRSRRFIPSLVRLETQKSRNQRHRAIVVTSNFTSTIPAASNQPAYRPSHSTSLGHEERTFHIFYQFLSGAAPQECDYCNTEDPSEYALLASSGCYRLPNRPFSDDAIALEEVRVALRTFGFKPNYLSSIFTILIAILLLGNIQFSEADAKDVSASVAHTPVPDHVARLLNVSSDDLTQALTNKTNHVCKELCTVLLNVGQSAMQRDSLMRDLYAILFACVVETADHEVTPANRDLLPTAQLILFDSTGFQTRGPTG